jgi:hypothetical protein
MSAYGTGVKTPVKKCWNKKQTKTNKNKQKQTNTNKHTNKHKQTQMQRLLPIIEL